MYQEERSILSGNTMNLLEALQKAKDNVRWLLDHEAGLIDMMGLTYWAGEVERLRKEIKATL